MTVEERRIAALESLVVYLIKESVRSSQGASSLLPSHGQAQNGQAQKYPILLPEFQAVADTDLVQARLEKLVDFALWRSDLNPA